MIERLVCVALLFACRTYAYWPISIPNSPECIHVVGAAAVCAMKFNETLLREVFERAASKSFGDKVSDCIEQSTPVNELHRGCRSEVAMTIAAHCYRKEVFRMMPRDYKYGVLVLLDELVECMATELRQPLSLLR
ncbi:uncharacterized protein LOC125945612 [Dermacentor silvarum]|uniref:uncharacterized protein LOC125945612 n=1 Tax=Dermacentor silvarum TaxID=543639 RepID=UPI00210122C8|nr:uncharacterized protein LOC125945612 [Dermacentor silvarum]